ncbi:predicted protein [Chaetoceros tenuissimus]|uniref:Uncharacterized protein n=1 Tax=Chaetoceros tenuissimus TaxID=426638 RepID=A0AAD3H7Z0_9STRA|nr:predicted protein [Chaetoceros tenuissimus]
MTGTMNHSTNNHSRHSANPNIIYPDFDDSVSYQNKNILKRRTSSTSSTGGTSLTNSSCWSFYIVCEQEIVGRYGEDLAGAFQHLHMFGKAYSHQKKKVNRAIIPVINHRVEHPERIHQINTSGKLMVGAPIQFFMDCCFWEDRKTLKQMQIVVQNEYNVLFPPTLFNARQRTVAEKNPEIIIDVPPELNGESQSMKIRNACYSYFQNLVVQLDVLSSGDGDHLPITK